MRRTRLLVGMVGLVVLVVVVAASVTVGSWLGARSVPRPGLPAAGVTAGVTPIVPGAPERVASLDLAVATGSNGIGAQDAVLTPDGRTVIAVGTDGRLTVADLATRRVDEIPTGTTQPLSSNLNYAAQNQHALALAPDARTVWVTDGWGRRVQVVDLATRTIVAAVAIPAVPTAVAVAGATAAVGDATGALTTLDAATRRPLAFRDVADGAVNDIVADPDGRRVVLAADLGWDYGPGSVSAVDLTNPRDPTVPYSWPVARPRGLGGTSMVVSPDGARAYVVTGSRLGAAGPDAATTGGVAVLDLNAGREVTNIPGSYAGAVALSPDGRRLYLGRAPEVATASGGQALSVLDTWDITAITATVTTPTSDIDSGPPGRLAGSLTQQSSSSSGGAWLLPTPDGRRLYAGGSTVISLRGR